MILLMATASLSSGELPTDIKAKFLKILCSSANSGGKVASKDAEINTLLITMGMSIDSAAKVAWATSEGDVTAYKGAGKLVITPKLEWLPAGGSVAIVEEGGKPQIYLHMGNIAASGLNLSDSILKIGKRL